MVEKIQFIAVILCIPFQILAQQSDSITLKKTMEAVTAKHKSIQRRAIY